MSGATQAELSREIGVTRARVQQIVAQIDPDGSWRDYQRIMSEFIDRQSRLRNCRLCGGLFTSVRGRKECSEEHGFVYRTYLMYHLDAGRHEQQQQAISRWMIQNPEKSQDFQLRQARRVLRGTNVIHEERRWFTDGSKAFAWARYGWRQGWEALSGLPDSMKQQIVDSLKEDAHAPKPEVSST